MFQVCHGEISIGTALRAFGLSGDQTFAFGLQFCSGNPLFPYYEFSRMDFLYRPHRYEYHLPTKKEEDHNPA